jgi:predicted ATPase
MLHSIKLTNLLSFGTETEITFNKGLNVLIGANGSGKSNLIEVISLLQALPKDLGKVIRDGGGIEEWLWKGEKNYSYATIDTVIAIPSGILLEHILGVTAINYRPEVEGELIFYKTEQDFFKSNEKPIYYFLRDESNKLGEQNNMADIIRRYPDSSSFEKEHCSENIETNESILAQRKDLHVYPEITNLGKIYQKIRLYHEWQFGKNNLSRSPQRADLPNDFLEEDASNLGLILNSFRRNSEVKRKLLEALKLFNANIEDFDVIVQGGYIQVFFEENGFSIPATRLSDGTLRYLCLLAILLHPNPPPLICIEEPELGLHPDILPTLIDLLKEAAEKTQIIMTTHSADLVDALSDTPEAVLVFDKQQGSTTVKRLNKEDLTEWLQEYSLGQLWSRGHIGGNRW